MIVFQQQKGEKIFNLEEYLSTVEHVPEPVKFTIKKWKVGIEIIKVFFHRPLPALKEQLTQR